MGWSSSDLDFAVVDRAQNLGQLLGLVFMLAGAARPKEVADALTEFDPRFAVDPETAGRWLRDERRPSKPHLGLIVRFFQSRRLIGSNTTNDRLFIRIAAFYKGLRGPIEEPSRLRRPTQFALDGDATPWPAPSVQTGERFSVARREYHASLALFEAMESPGTNWESSVPIFPAPPVPAILPDRALQGTSALRSSMSWQKWFRALFGRQ